MPLTEMTIRQAKPGRKSRKLFDSGGLYLEIAPSGGKWWRLKYRYQGKEKRISLGVYPGVGLREARERRDTARAALAGGKEPLKLRKSGSGNSDSAEEFQHLAREWVQGESRHWSKDYTASVLRRFENDIFPHLGGQPIMEISAADLLAVIRKIERREAYETAHRTLQYCGRVFRFAVATGRATSDPSRDLQGALAPVPKQHHASVTDPRDVAFLLRAIEDYSGSFITRCALRLAPIVFVRPGELRAAEWNEVEVKDALWRIQPHRMKMKRQHLVPLSRQSLSILHELRPLTGEGKYIFPSVRSISRPMSENTLNAALRRLGYDKSEMTAHGFRSMASTLLNEQGWDRDVIERQLAHSERDSVRAAYNYAEYLDERRKMMQEWANYLDSLRRVRRV